MSTVFQSSMNSLNPVMKIEDQFRDVIEMHTDLRGDAVTERAAELLELVRSSAASSAPSRTSCRAA